MFIISDIQLPATAVKVYHSAITFCFPEKTLSDQYDGSSSSSSVGGMIDRDFRSCRHTHFTNKYICKHMIQMVKMHSQTQE